MKIITRKLNGDPEFYDDEGEEEVPKRVTTNSTTTQCLGNSTYFRSLWTNTSGK